MMRSPQHAAAEMSPGEVDVWRMRVGAGEAREKARELLGAYAGCSAEAVAAALRVGRNGKPFLAAVGGGNGRDIRFNLSHSGGAAVVAVAWGVEVGVDVEALRSVSRGREIARRFFSSRELAGLDAVSVGERDAAFLRLWTRYEASVKAHGFGVWGASRAGGDFFRAEGWRVWDLSWRGEDGREYLAALCADRNAARVRSGILSV